MRTTTYKRKLSRRRNRFVMPKNCQCRICWRQAGRSSTAGTPIARPDDYEPDYDGPNRTDSSEG